MSHEHNRDDSANIPAASSNEKTPAFTVTPAIDRRRLLVGASAGAVLGLVGSQLANAGASTEPAATGPTGAKGTAAAPAPAATFALAEATVAELSAKMASGELTARRIAELYLERIAAVDVRDGRGLGLGSIIELNPDTLRLADELDAERRAGKLRGPLHGIPLLVKDNLDTGDQMETTAGSLALVGLRRPHDAHAVSRLRAAGALLLGKTNLSEWANFRSTRSVSGWSGRGGQTRNPYALDRNPCGSSSGTGAALAADLATLGVGTETDGSIVCPASICGLVGIKPTVGLVSRRGIVPISHSQDTAGPMCRTVTDAALLLAALAGSDPGDPATQAAKVVDYRPFLDPRGLVGKRIGVARNHFGFDSRVDGLIEQAIAALRDGGAEVIDPTPLPHAGEVDQSELEVLLYEFKSDLEVYLASLPSPPNALRPPRTLADLIAWNEAHAEQEMPIFGQELFHQAAAKGPLSEPAYLEALAKNHRLTRDEGIDAVLAAFRLDALVAPSNAPAWLTDPVRGDFYGGGSSTPAAVAGYPAVTVPAGLVSGLPVGVTFYGAAWSEPTLIAIAFAFEQATRARRPPRFMPTVELG